MFIDEHIVEVHWRCARKIILDLVFGGFPFLLCCSGAYGLASRCNFPVIAMDVFIDAHIVEVHWRCTRKILGLKFRGFPFLLCCSGACGLASRCHFQVTAIDVFIDAHIVEVHWRCTGTKNSWPHIWGISVFFVLQWCIWIGIEMQFSHNTNSCVDKCTHC
jgi:hypothetical protein